GARACPVRRDDDRLRPHHSPLHHDPSAGPGPRRDGVAHQPGAREQCRGGRTFPTAPCAVTIHPGRRPRTDHLLDRHRHRPVVRPRPSESALVTRYLLAGGGTAGHVNPLLALADGLREAEPDAEIIALGTKEGLESRLVPARGYEL